MGLRANTGPSKHRNEYTFGSDYMLETQLNRPKITDTNKQETLSTDYILETQSITLESTNNTHRVGTQ